MAERIEGLTSWSMQAVDTKHAVGAERARRAEAALAAESSLAAALARAEAARVRTEKHGKSGGGGLPRGRRGWAG